LIPGIQIAALPVMGGLVMLVIPPVNRIIIQTNLGSSRAIDIDSRLDSSEGISIYLADQIRKCAKTDKRISYVIYNGRICSKILNWKWRKYRGINPHRSHMHISFTKAGDKNGKPFDIPLLGGKI
jgi:hypothetical protein